MPTTEAQKKANKNWRINNKEKYNTIQLANNIKFYYENREKILEKKRLVYSLKKKNEQNKQNEKNEEEPNISL